MIDFAQARVERPELARRLAQGLDRGSVLLVADAGFGKTTALEQALRERGETAVWVRATEADRDPGRLVARLVEGVRARLPGVAEEHAERLATALEPIDAQAVAQDLVEDLDRLLVEPLVVAVDDAEQLEGAGSLAILDVLLAGELVRVALCSRRALGLRLARLRAGGHLLELGAADLAFSPAECGACIEAVRGSEPPDEEVERLFTLTEGWPLGVALAAAADTGAGELAPASREAIFDYLAEEVLDGLDPKIRDRLRDASVVDELDPSIEDALGLPSSFRDDLVAAGVFVRSHDGDGYSIHPLMRDFLRARLAEERDGAELGDLRVRAAGALAAAGQVPEAIEQWLAAGAFDQAADAIAGHGVALAGAAPETVRGWLGRLPDEVRERAMLRLLAGRLAMGEGDFGTAVEQCAAGVAELEREGAHEALLWSGRLALTDAHIAALDLEAAAEACAGAEDTGPEAGPAAVFCSLMHPALLLRLGRGGSDQAMDAALERPIAHAVLGPGLAAFRAQYRELPAGHLDDALRHLNEGVAGLEAHDPYNRLAYVLAFKMAIHEARGELEQALDAFDELQRAAQRTGLAGFIGAGARLSAATILVLLDRPQEARVQLERVDRRWSSWVGCDQHVARALLAAGEGDRSVALAEARRGLEESRRMPPFDRVRPLSVLAPVLCDVGDPTAAREALEDLLEALGPGDSQARTRIALACVLHHLGEEPGANSALAAGLAEVGEAGRFVLRSEWPQVEPVLWTALESGAVEVEPAVAALAAAFPGGAELVPLAEHPSSEVRDAALLAAASSGRPEALTQLADASAGDGSPHDFRERLVRRPPPLSFRTLGRFEVRRGAWLVDATRWERKVAERVVRFLLIRDGELVPEDELFEAFWPGKDLASARRGLQTAISSARGVLDLPWESTRLHAEERTYALVLGDGDGLDAVAFTSVAERALGTEGSERIARLEAAARVWAGEPLPEERYSDWATAWRERLGSLYADVLGALGEAHGQGGDHAAAVRAARALVELDPLDEHSQRLLMSAYAAAGRRGDALRQFLECRRALVEELGIEPGAETVALQRRILAGG